MPDEVSAYDEERFYNRGDRVFFNDSIYEADSDVPPDTAPPGQSSSWGLITSRAD